MSLLLWWLLVASGPVDRRIITLKNLACSRGLPVRGLTTVPENSKPMLSPPLCRQEHRLRIHANTSHSHLQGLQFYQGVGNAVLEGPND